MAKNETLDRRSLISSVVTDIISNKRVHKEETIYEIIQERRISDQR